MSNNGKVNFDAQFDEIMVDIAYNGIVNYAKMIVSFDMIDVAVNYAISSFKHFSNEQLNLLLNKIESFDKDINRFAGMYINAVKRSIFQFFESENRKR